MNKLLILCIFTFSLSNAFASDDKLAAKAAEKWLQLVDQGQLSEGWQQLSDDYKNNVDERTWREALQINALSKQANIISRKIVKIIPWHDSTVNSTSEYKMVLFKTFYDDNSESSLIITPRRENDGEWRVAGFFFR